MSKAWTNKKNSVVPLLYGFSSNREGSGVPVASASDAKESMIKLTHNIWTAVRGDSAAVIAPPAAVATATKLTVS